MIDNGTSDATTYSLSQTSTKCEKALAPVMVLLIVFAGFWVANVPTMKVLLVSGIPVVKSVGVISLVNILKVPFTRLSYENPVCTG